MKNKPEGLSLATVQRVAELYGVEVDSVAEVESGYRNLSHSFIAGDGRKLNFILYKREAGSVELIKRVNQLGGFLAKRGLSVRHPVDQRILRVGGRYGSLYNYLLGGTIPWEAYTMKHIKLLGWTLAQFHDSAASFDGDLPAVESVYLEISSNMRAYFDDAAVRQAMKQKLGLEIKLPDFTNLLESARQLPDRLVLHMDLVRSNVLFQSSRAANTASDFEPLQIGDIAVSGIIDLEKATRGHMAFDIARTLAFLLVDCNKPAEKIRKYFLESGYRKRGGRDLRRISVGGGDFLEQLVTMFLVYDFYKFLRQNPYESLSSNHHFVGTVRILRQREVIQ